MVKRSFVIGVSIPAVVIGLIALSLLGTQAYLSWKDFPISKEAPEWSVLAEEEIPSIVTFDVDGSTRITQLWFAVVANQAYIRTGDTEWFANLERDPRLELRVGGIMYPCRTQLVTEPNETQRVHEAFRVKYARRSAFFRSIGISTNTVIELDCSRAA